MKFHKVCEAFWILSVLAVSSCNGTAVRPDGNEAGGPSVVQESEGGGQAAAGMLPMPAIPDSLRTVEDRAAYFVTHYWDAMDFEDTSLSLDTAFVEQNFSNFIALLPVAPTAVADSAVGSLLARSAAEPRAFELLVATADNYLDHPNSPMRNEETYILFLRHLLAPSVVSPALLTESSRLRLEHRLEEALKNRPGTRAADFRFVTRQLTGGDGGVDGENPAVAVGPETTLLKSLAAARQTLVVFYDPDCEHCKEIMRQLATADLPTDVNVLAIAVETDRESWEMTAGSLPLSWTVGFATTPIVDQELYSFPAAPTLYLLDGDGTVIMKDAPVEAVINNLQHS